MNRGSASPASVLFCAALVGALLASEPVRAQVFLKPNGQNAVPLRLKALATDVQIDRAFAATTLTLTFQNETPARIEADFLYTLPPRALVTGFAYWYGDEKVVARIVEKERAAAIYEHITTRMRDPALVEMVGKNTFRARIFPVMPNSDLMVEIKLAQTLASDEEGLFYDLPLRTEKGHTLDSVDVHVHVKPDASIERVENNSGLSVITANDGYRLALTATNDRPRTDLRVRLVRKPQPLHAALYAARSGGPDGFFALALTPERALRRPAVKIRGVATYQIVPAALPGVQAHHTLTLFGRYRGSGAATVVLEGDSQKGHATYSQPIVFSDAQEANNIATKLWSAGRIEQLSTTEAHREAVVALSTRFTLPSKFTSWLAVPKEELERYKQEKLEADLQIVAGRLARLNLDGQGGTPAARQLRTRLETLCREAGRDPKQVMSGYLEARVYSLATELVAERHRPGRHAARLASLQRQFYRLARETDMSTRRVLSQVEGDWTRTAIEHVADRLQRAIVVGHEHTPSARRLWARLNGLCRQVSDNPSAQLRGYLEDTLYRLATHIVEERHRESPNAVRLVLLRRKLDRIARTVGDRPEGYIDAMEIDWKNGEPDRILGRIVAEHRKRHPDPQTTRELSQRYLKLRGDSDYEKARIERVAVRTDAETLDRLLSALSWTAAEKAEMEKRRAELRKREDELRARMGDPLLRIDAPADAVQVVALMPEGEVKRFVYNPDARQWEARFDIPTYAAEGRYVVTILIVLKDGTRKRLEVAYNVDLTPPTGVGQARIVTQAGQLRRGALIHQGQADPSEPRLRLEVDASDDTARVTALLPWGEQIVLNPSVLSHRFFALTPIPPAHRDAACVVTFILTDRAHNRTVMTVDAREDGGEAGR